MKLNSQQREKLDALLSNSKANFQPKTVIAALHADFPVSTNDPVYRTLMKAKSVGNAKDYDEVLPHPFCYNPNSNPSKERERQIALKTENKGDIMQEVQEAAGGFEFPAMVWNVKEDEEVVITTETPMSFIYEGKVAPLAKQSAETLRKFAEYANRLAGQMEDEKYRKDLEAANLMFEAELASLIKNWYPHWDEGKTGYIAATIAEEGHEFSPKTYFDAKEMTV